MKTELERDDIQAIADEVYNRLRPMLAAQEGGRAEDEVLDVPGLARLLKVEESWVYKKVSTKSIPHFKAGKYVRFRRAEILDWAASQTTWPR
jgi:excisionase family DNA binding protein